MKIKPVITTVVCSAQEIELVILRCPPPLLSFNQIHNALCGSGCWMARAARRKLSVQLKKIKRSVTKGHLAYISNGYVYRPSVGPSCSTVYLYTRMHEC